MASPRPDDSGCPDFERTARLDRRRLLEIGALYGLGFSLPELFRARAQAAPATSGTFGRARSVILLYLHGGHAQQETWDPKPDGPYPARGEFGAIATSVPGVRIGELLPLSARMVHKLALIRSLSHANANHVQASLPAMTGHAHLRSDESKGDFPPSPTDFPPFGAVLNHLRPAGKLPTWVQVGPLMRRNNGTVLHGQSPGFLGGKHSPLVIDQDLQGRDVRVEAVSANAQVPLLRLQGRKELLQQVDGQRLQWEQNIDVQDLDAYQQKALNLLTSPAMAKAFNLAAGEYLGDLYRYGFDTPEAHVIRKGRTLYYGFFVEPRGTTYRGDLELRGLGPGSYRIEDYVNRRVLGTARGPTAVLKDVNFTNNMLLRAVPVR